jgi:hypothetical protein
MTYLNRTLTLSIIQYPISIIIMIVMVIIGHYPHNATSLSQLG